MSDVELVTVGAEEGEQRLDRWFRRRYPDVTHVRLQKLLRTGQVRLDGKRAAASDRVAAGQVVRVPPLGTAPARRDPETASKAPRPPRPAEARALADLRRRILYEDDLVIAFDKPAGLAVQGGTGTDVHVDGLLTGFARGGERPRLVHRLDRDTSGVLVCARTARAAAALSRAFQGRATRKLYWAVTVGVPEPAMGRIDQPLAKLPGRAGERVAPDEAGQRAVTLYAVLDRAHREAAFLALSPLTGRTHQLRVHAAEVLKTPILGDGKYAGAAAQLPGSDLARALHLHARRLTVPHPAGGGRMLDLVAPPPPHMADTFAYFGFAPADSDPDPFGDD